jgi:cytochrome c
MARLVTISIVLLALASGRSAQAGDPQRGANVFRTQCSMCHSGVRAGPANFGPNLFGIVGRKPGSLPGFDYSQALKSAPALWTPDRLRSFVETPGTAVPGVKMPYAGLRDPDAREDLIAYLATLK